MQLLAAGEALAMQDGIDLGRQHIGNAIAVGLLSIVNFIVSDRWVFTLPPSPTGFERPRRSSLMIAKPSA